MECPLLYGCPAGKYLFEKLMSGMYVGEVARRILARLVTDASGSVPRALTEKDGFPTSALSAVVESKGSGRVVARVLGVSEVSARDCHTVRA